MKMLMEGIPYKINNLKELFAAFEVERNGITLEVDGVSFHCVCFILFGIMLLYMDKLPFLFSLSGFSVVCA